MANNSSRYHAEIKVHVGPNEARINIFADTLVEIFADLGTVQAQLGRPDPVTNPAMRDIVNAERKASQVLDGNGHPLPPPGQQPSTPPPPPDTPVCVHCGSSAHMELIEFTSKKTGKPTRAWKCQECEEWHFPNAKKK